MMVRLTGLALGMRPWGGKGRATLEVTQGQILSQSPMAIDGFLSQLTYKCHQNRVASVGFAPGLPPALGMRPWGGAKSRSEESSEQV